MKTLKTLLLASLLLPLATMPSHAAEATPKAMPAIIAHRGASYDAPENTMAAFRLAWEQKCDAIELDVHLTKDGRLAVIHDANTKRTAGADKPVAQQTLAELRALDAGSWKGPRWAGEKIPTLDEVLETVPEGKQAVIEIKCGAEALPELERVVAASGRKPEQLVLIGFGYATMQAAKARLGHLKALWLVSARPGKEGPVPTLDEMIEKARTARFDGLNLDYHFPIDAAFVAKANAAGPLYTWTVDDAEAAKRLVQAGVVGITTNRPAWMREKLQTAQP